MNGKDTSGVKIRYNLKRIKNHWFLEVGDRLHRLSILDKANCVHMEEKVIFADESMYQVQVYDSNEVNIVEIKDICESVSQSIVQSSNERLSESEDNLCTSISQDDELLSNERLPNEDGNDSANNVSVDTDEGKDLADNSDDTLEFGNEEYAHELDEDESCTDKHLEWGSDEVIKENSVVRKNICVTALYDFEAILDDELSFKAGDVFIINSQNLWSNNIWVKATHNISGQTGFIPSNYVKEDFKPLYLYDWWQNWSREETEKILMSPDYQDGTFVIRDSSDKKALVLSVKAFKERTNTYHIFNYKIDETNGEFYIEERHRFADMTNLIQFYKSPLGSGLCCKLSNKLIKKIPDIPLRRLEIQRTSLVCNDVLCTDMRKGKWGDEDFTIKEYKQSMINNFLREIDILKQLQHKNVIGLLAVYSKEEPFLMVSEIMEKGPLGIYLRQDNGKCLQLHELLSMTIEIAEGMAYLGSKGLVHRDLKADNILVNCENKVKIAGFTLARWLRNGVYRPSVGEKVPIKWTAIERFNEGIYTSKSDVWSFGVLLYEVITFGAMPYRGQTNDETVRMIKEGNRMKKPEDGPLVCPQECYDIMLKCWDKSPAKRPTFHNIVIELCNSYSQLEKKILHKTGECGPPDINVGGKKDVKKECVCM